MSTIDLNKLEELKESAIRAAAGGFIYDGIEDNVVFQKFVDYVNDINYEISYDEEKDCHIVAHDCCEECHTNTEGRLEWIIGYFEANWHKTFSDYLEWELRFHEKTEDDITPEERVQFMEQYVEYLEDRHTMEKRISEINRLMTDYCNCVDDWY